MTQHAASQQLETRHDRVRDHSAQSVNRARADEIDDRVERCKRQGRDAILSRLTELNHEWDIDQSVMATFAFAGGFSFAQGLRHQALQAAYERTTWSRIQNLWSPHRERTEPNRWFYLLGTQLAFLLVHAAAGWCPPAALLRRVGVRTRHEIETERGLLQAGLEQAV